MAHNLGTTNGRTAMAYYGAKPWHSLGTPVDKAMTAAEALTLAGLDWQVAKSPVMYQAERTGGIVIMPEKFVTVRGDTGEALGVVGAIYRVLQNKEAFSFTDAIIGEKLAVYHTAGALGKGERVWMLAKLPEHIIVNGKDKVEEFLLVSNSHDGSSAVSVMFTPIRVVCQNTLNDALGTNKSHYRVRHTTNMGAGVSEIRRALGFATNYFNLFGQAANLLGSKQANSEVVDKLFDDLGLKVKDVKGDTTRKRNIRDNITNLYQVGRGNSDASVRGTMWALYNGVTEYVDYARSGKSDTRTESILFGSGAQMKQKAFSSLLALAK